MKIKFKKLTALVLAIVVIACMPIVNASAVTTLTVANATAEAGSDVEVAINLSGNESGILGMMISVSYDKGLILKSVSAGSALSSLDFTPGKDLSANPINIGWDGLDADSTNGTVAVLTFTVPEDATGSYDIGISYSVGNIYDNDFNDINVVTVSGSITVNSAPVVTEPSLSYDNIVKGSNNINFDIKLTSPEDICGKVYVALYDGKKMLKAKLYNAEELVNATIEITNGKYIKVFWWDSEFKPVTEHLKIDL